MSYGRKYRQHWETDPQFQGWTFADIFRLVLLWLYVMWLNQWTFTDVVYYSSADDDGDDNSRGTGITLHLIASHYIF